MKIKKGYVMILLLTMGFMTGCASKTEQEMISESVGVDCSKGEVVISEDTHGGMQGDGQTYIELSFPNGEPEEEMKQNAYWKELPLSKNVSAIVYGYDEITEFGAYSQNAMFLDYSDSLSYPKPRIPEIENGYYYFEDRLLTDENRWDDSEVLEREAHYNFIFAIYDKDTQRLYFGERNN